MVRKQSEHPSYFCRKSASNQQTNNYLHKVMLLFCGNKILLVDAVFMSCDLNHYYD